MSIWQELEKVKKRKNTAQIGGFRPVDEIKSWFGGNFFGKSNDDWPKDSDGNMTPLLQIYIPEIQCVNEYFGGAKLIQVFLNRNTLPINTEVKNGEGWLLREYENISDLEILSTPDDVNIYKTFQIKWSLSESFDYPTWEESWNYLDMSEINNSDEMTSQFFNKYVSENVTKIGGYGSYIQSPPITDNEFVFQISSDEKSKFYVGHGGNLYILKSPDKNEWFLHWDCY